MLNKQKIEHEVSLRTVLKIVLILGVFYLFYMIKDVLGLLFASIVLATAFEPFADFLQKKKMPRFLAMIIIYVLFLGFLSLSIYLILPLVKDQLDQLIFSLPNYYQKLNLENSINNEFLELVRGFSQNIATGSGNFWGSISGVFGGLVQTISLLAIVFYLVVEENGLKKTIRSVFPNRYQKLIALGIEKIQNRVGFWLRAELVLMLVVGVFTYFVLLLLGIKYALLLAVIAGLLEIIPFLGPIIAAVPALFIALTDSWLKVLLVGIAYFLIQQAENNILVPKVMQKATGLNPIVTIVVILIGGKLGGLVGVLVAVPVAVMVMAVIDNFEILKKEHELIK
jgi:predicted PurR-regulated permease PerM